MAVEKHPILGLPILTFRGIEELQNDLQSIGVVKHTILTKNLLAEVDMSQFTEEQLPQFRFAPKIFLIRIEGSDNLWFATQPTDWANVIIITPDNYIILAAEWFHGIDDISVTPPAGARNKEESWETAITREAAEEVGIKLKEVIPLAKVGLPVSSRKSSERAFPFLGIPELDRDGNIALVERHLDETEEITPFLMPVNDYWEYLSNENYDGNNAARDAFYTAMRYLGKLKFA